MKLVFIHGGPAAGKLTTARALLSLVNGRLFDNRATIHVPRTVFDFGAPGFWELVQVVRMSVLDAAAERCTPLVVMTSVYVEPDDLPIFEQFESIVQRRGGQILPVFLQCSTEEIIRRIGNADRIDQKTIASEQGARNFMAEHKVRAVPRRNCLVLASETRAAKANVQEIARHFRPR